MNKLITTAVMASAVCLPLTALSQETDWKSASRYDKSETKKQLAQRLTEYVAFDTQASDQTDKVPSTAGQMKLAKALLLGNRIAIFPEGTRTKDGEIAEFKQTFAILAKETKTPVVPVCISGAYENIPAGKTLPKFGSRISVKYLKEMVPEDGESYQAFADRVRAEIEKNMPDLRRNERADAPESK